jgi:type II secretory pathway pseudopilin PulG
MAKILEEIQSRLAEAQKRLAETTQALQVAQQAQQAAQHNFNVWNMALQIEQRDEQRRVAAATEKQLSLPATQPESKPQPKSDSELELEDFVDAVLSEDASEGVNKTDTVRDLLRRHPTGMTAVDIWAEVRSDFKHRPYLYSVLKRLRDREEIIKRRGKYCLKLIPKTQEAQDQSVVH